MIKHIVMWKLKPEAEGHTARENAQWMKEHLESLMGVVPELLSCEVGINVVDGNYDACLISTFASIEDMETYKKHPAHVAISTYCKKVRESRVACDFVIE
ncbi:MAG: Dabb family protein [Bacteroidaceae bacterium]|nr:Dabb family protein [Bacteroidaceae bacterium]